MTDTDVIPPNKNNLGPPDPLRDQEQSDTISWKGRHVDLKPKCCQRNSTRKLAGTILLSLGILLSAATAVTMILFTSTLMAAGLATFSILTVAPGTTFLALRKSTQDPQTRIQMGQSAVQAIKKENLNYKQIRQRYGQQIDSLKILTDHDINILLRKDIDHNELTYSGCIDRHGKDFLKIIDAKNRIVLRKKFLQLINPEDTGAISLKKILADYSEDIKALHITAEEISDILHDDTNDLSYALFLDKHGIDFLNDDWIYTPQGSAPARLLNVDARENLKDSFIEHLSATNISLVAAKKDHIKEMGLLSISEQDLIDTLTTRDLEKTLKNKTGYLEFLKRNPGQGIRFGSTDIIEEFKVCLLKEIQQDTIGMKELLEKFPDDLKSLGISERDLANVTIHRDLAKLQNGTLTYEEYQKTHGFDSIKNYLLDPAHPLFDPNKKQIAHDAFLKQPYYKMTKAVYNEDRGLLGVTDNEIFDVVKRDLINPSSYATFTDRHGTTWVKDLNCTPAIKSFAEDKLVNEFKRTPYSTFRSYLPHLRELGAAPEKIAKLMQKACKQPFADLIAVHGYEWLDVEEFKNDATIKSSLEKTSVIYIMLHAKEALTNEPQSATNLCPVIIRHQLLPQGARDILARSTNGYVQKNIEFTEAIHKIQKENQNKKSSLHVEFLRLETEKQSLERSVSLAKVNLETAQLHYDAGFIRKNMTPQHIQVNSVPQSHVHIQVGQPALQRHSVGLPQPILSQTPGTVRPVHVATPRHTQAQAATRCHPGPVQMIQNNPACVAVEHEVTFLWQTLNQKTCEYNNAVSGLHHFETNSLPRFNSLQTELENLPRDEKIQIDRLTQEFEQHTNSLARQLSNSLAALNP